MMGWEHQFALERGVELGKIYACSDGKRRALEVARHFGNVQVKTYKPETDKTEWLSMGEWKKLNPKACEGGATKANRRR